MPISKANLQDLIPELQFTFSRSSGPGGQHINKVNTKVDLRFNIRQSKVLTEDQKEILLSKLYSQLNQKGEFIIVCQETRSQIKNKEIAIKKLLSILDDTLKPIKKRKPTKATKASKEKRLQGKKEQAEKKTRRIKPNNFN